MCEVDDPVRIIIKDKNVVYLDVGVKTANALSQYLNSFVEVFIDDLRITIEVKDDYEGE